MNQFIKLELDMESELLSQIQTLEKEILLQDQKLLTKTWAGNDFLGWLDIQKLVSQDEIKKIKNLAKHFQTFERVVVIGIWGSYLWAKAILEALQNNFSEEKIIFAWFQMDSNYLKDLQGYLENKNYGIIVISKSGTTLEPAVTFRVLLQDLQKKYPSLEISKRVVAITDEQKWVLKDFATKNGFETFVIPDDVGGRYSVLTPVGLFPIAVAWHDIEKMLLWASDMQKYIDETKDISKNPAYLYAGARNILLKNEKNIEILSTFEKKLCLISEWWKQLFWESEGKDGKGIFPANLNYSTDLHSMWQYVQDGRRNLFETFLIIKNQQENLKIPYAENDDDRLNFLAWKPVSFVNNSALTWTIQAHKEWWVPIIKIILPEWNEYYLGQLLYFFERSCALSAYMIWVNPFNQPGVEAYKKYMMEIVNK